MTVENTLPHGLKTSVIDTDYETEDKENLAVLDKNRVQVGLFANRPAVGVAERFYYATDTGDLYYDDGTSWLGVADAISNHSTSHAAGGGDALTHQNLSGAGSNSHAQIDTHVADGSKHFALLDEDDMTSDDASKGASQQSVKAYSDTKALLAGSTGQAFACSHLAFPSTRVPSGNANTLDDYEESTWTPTVVAGGISAHTSYYTKIGNIVFIRTDLTFNGGATDACDIGGLPFTVKSDISSSFSIFANGLKVSTGGTAPMARATKNTTTINIYAFKDSGLASLYQNGGSLIIAGHYEV